MFDRTSYKSTAKEKLRGTWFPTAAIVTIVWLVVEVLLATLGNKGNPTMNIVYKVLFFLVNGPFFIALAYFYLEYRKLSDGEKPKFDTFIEGFNCYLQGILGLLWIFIWFLLWFICFIIPGLIKLVAYSQMFYILAENPKISISKAMRMSMEITKGHKSDIFITLLSFLGWILLSVITGGILFIWVLPYIQLTFANVYQYLKSEALRTGSLTQADFDEGK